MQGAGLSWIGGIAPKLRGGVGGSSIPKDPSVESQCGMWLQEHDGLAVSGEWSDVNCKREAAHRSTADAASPRKQNDEPGKKGACGPELLLTWAAGARSAPSCSPPSSTRSVCSRSMLKSLLLSLRLMSLVLVLVLLFTLLLGASIPRPSTTKSDRTKHGLYSTLAGSSSSLNLLH